MKIICMARNYVAHARELNNPLPGAPVFFMKHENAIVRNNRPFFYPDFSRNIHHEVEVVLKKDPGYFGWILNGDFPLYTKNVMTRIKIRTFGK